MQHLEGGGHAERTALEHLAEVSRLVDGGQVGADDPTGAECHLGMRNHPPRLGEVENDPIQAPLLDPVVDVAQLHPVVGPVANHGGHVDLGPLGEVLAQFVADDRGPSAQHGHRQRT